MSLLCIQCAMEALVADKQYEPTNETADAHMRRVHPDPIANNQRRDELKKLIANKLSAP